MPAQKEQPSFADYVAIVIGPALIMALVGSLVFFLLDILYLGQYGDRLRWIMACFVFAAALVARISMTAGIAERASLYGLSLAAATFIALQKFVEYPPGSPAGAVRWLINLGIMAVIWWCAHRLTWDCTYIDEHLDSSGVGLLDAAGLDEGAPTEAVDRSDRATPHGGGLLGWWDRYRLYQRDQRAKPHTPGTWVVYFSLAALPVFGLGQALIPAGAADRRRFAFWLMVIYVASALGLLLTTSFLGLRRYLRQRNLRMPAPMTGVWLAIGASLIVLLLAFGAILPRPDAEYALIRLPAWLSSPEQNASRYAVYKGDAAKGEGSSGKPGEGGRQGGAAGKGAKESGGNGKGNGQSSASQTQGKGQSQGGKQGNGSGGEKSNQGSSGDKANQGADGKSNRAAGQNENAKQRGDSVKRMNESDQSSSLSSPPPTPSGSWLQALGKLLKWIVFAIVALIVAFVVLRALLKFLANFTGWARGLLDALEGLWRGLFGWMTPSAPEEDEDFALESRREPRPFAAFRNPFTDGSASQMPPEEVVRYSFAALEAWAHEQGLDRRADDTPLEFAERVTRETPRLGSEAQRLASLYARAAYAHGRLPSSSLETVRRFWQRLERTPARSAIG